MRLDDIFDRCSCRRALHITPASSLLLSLLSILSQLRSREKLCRQAPHVSWASIQFGLAFYSRSGTGSWGPSIASAHHRPHHRPSSDHSTYPPPRHESGSLVAASRWTVSLVQTQTARATVIADHHYCCPACTTIISALPHLVYGHFLLFAPLASSVSLVFPLQSRYFWAERQLSFFSSLLCRFFPGHSIIGRAPAVHFPCDCCFQSPLHSGLILWLPSCHSSLRPC